MHDPSRAQFDHWQSTEKDMLQISTMFATINYFFCVESKKYSIFLTWLAWLAWEIVELMKVDII